MKFIKQQSNSRGVISTLDPQNVEIRTENLSVLGNTAINGDASVSGKIISSVGYIETVSMSGDTLTLKRFEANKNITAKCVINGYDGDGMQASEILLVINSGVANTVEYGVVTTNNDKFTVAAIPNGQFIDLVVSGVDLTYNAHFTVLEV